MSFAHRYRKVIGFVRECPEDRRRDMQVRVYECELCRKRRRVAKIPYYERQRRG